MTFIGQDLKLVIKSIHPAILMDAVVTVVESKWIMADNTKSQTKDEWVEEHAADMFGQLKAEVNS